MKRLFVLFLLASCASPFPIISTQGKTIENARQLLNGYDVKVTRYTNENAEAWYFNKNECVLFIDGKLRYTTYTVKSVDGAAPNREAAAGALQTFRRPRRRAPQRGTQREL